MNENNKTVGDLTREAEYHAKQAATFGSMANEEPEGKYRDRLEASYVFHASRARRLTNEARRLGKLVLA